MCFAVAIRATYIDIESVVTSNYARRGLANTGAELVQWQYWIPCSDSQWLEACAESLRIIDDRQGELLTDKQLYKGLQLGGWCISLRTEIEEVKSILTFIDIINPSPQIDVLINYHVES